MVEFVDMLQCPVCDAFYRPEVQGCSMIPHCALPDDHLLGHGGAVERGIVKLDLGSVERRVVAALLTERVVDPSLTGYVVSPPLTGRFVDIKV